MAALIAVYSKPIHFRHLNVSIEVGQTDEGKSVIKIDAHDEFLRGDFQSSKWPSVSDEALTGEEKSQRRHHVCNQLQVAAMSLEILTRRVAEEDDDVEPILEMAIESLEELDNMVEATIGQGR